MVNDRVISKHRCALLLNTKTDIHYKKLEFNKDVTKKATNKIGDKQLQFRKQTLGMYKLQFGS